MNKEPINKGFTNHTYIKDDLFIIEKNKNQFNHNLDYSQLINFKFVPQLIEINDSQIIWKKIDDVQLMTKWENKDLELIAKQIGQIHQSEINLPKNNLRQRINNYLKIIHNKKIHVNEIEDNYKEMIKILRNAQNIYPCHNDLSNTNILKDKNNYLWIVDWEYATMGDYYFDLAYFIQFNNLNDQQIKMFLNYYQTFTNFEVDEYILNKYFRFFHWLVLLWAYSQKDCLPFDVNIHKKFLNTI